MTKKKKIIVISVSAVASAVITYFGLGLIGTSVAIDSFINVRNSDPSLLEDDFFSVQKCRPDYESLKNREEITFPCGKETLMGYLYESPSPKGVIIMAHGVKNNADANPAQLENYYVNHNYHVFAFDMTGCGLSTGKGIRTLYESRNCVSNAVKTVKKHNKTKNLPIFLMGHSFGGYGVVTATDDVDGVSAVVAFSAFNTPNEMMYAFAETNTSKVAILTKPAIQFGISMRWGGKAFYSAENAVKKHQDIPYIIIHGDKDKTVPYQGVSLYDNVVRDNYKNVTAISLPGIHHGAPWKTVEAETYTGECEKGLKELRKQYKNKLPEDVRKAYLANVDKEKASKINADLLKQIDELLTSSIH